MDRRWVISLGLVGVVLVAAMVMPAVLSSILDWGSWHPWMGWGFGWMWFMPLFMIAFWALVIGAVVALVRSSGLGTGTHREESAMEILRRRYARGDISKEEYEEKRRDLA